MCTSLSQDMVNIEVAGTRVTIDLTAMVQLGDNGEQQAVKVVFATGGAGIKQARISAIQTLYKIFVRCAICSVFLRICTSTRK